MVATPEQKIELIEKMTDTFVSVLGDVVQPFTYVIIDDTPVNQWGIAGVPMPDLAHLTGEKHADVIRRSNELMLQAIEEMKQAAESEEKAAE